MLWAAVVAFALAGTGKFRALVALPIAWTAAAAMLTLAKAE
jgi:hypothetical protein